MAVFTPVSDAEIALWLDQYDVGAVRAFRGIPSGIENSNFFLTTEKDGQTHEYVVTLFERLTFEQLPFYLYLICLLYTSPSPRDQRGARMPSSA